MKKLACTVLRNEDAEVFFNEYEDGTYTKVIDEIESESSIDELQEFINSGEYQVSELTF